MLMCPYVWLPIACPAAATSRRSAGSRCANSPIEKNVARTSWRASTSSSVGVQAVFGPSS
jgi:hypothetical protein